MLLQSINIFAQLLDLLLDLLHGVQFMFDGHHVTLYLYYYRIWIWVIYILYFNRKSLQVLSITHLGHLALAALHRFGQLLELSPDLAQGDRRLQVSIASLEFIEFRWQIHAHHANLLLQTMIGWLGFPRISFPNSPKNSNAWRELRSRQGFHLYVFFLVSFVISFSRGRVSGS